ncbi:MAG: hypothetical protein JXX14_19525 [Deltaproteobacteria bacterium]|nr:hypothetical protein [Deltaproteobacteria bacterium]
MNETEFNDPTKRIIDEALMLARNTHVPNWQERIAQMDRRVAHLHEQVRQQPIVPTELQDAYRSEIDSLTLENMALKAKLDQTREALERARAAYKSEREQTRMLQIRLNDLEKRLLEYLGR